MLLKWVQKKALLKIKVSQLRNRVQICVTNTKVSFGK